MPHLWLKEKGALDFFNFVMHSCLELVSEISYGKGEIRGSLMLYIQIT